MEELFEENKSILKKDYENKMTQVESLPKNLEVMVSNECNLKCIMCNFGVNDKKYSAGFTDEIYQRIKPLFPCLEMVKLNGVEIFNTPFDEKQLIDNIMIESQQFKNMKLAGTTNGNLLGKERAEIIQNKFDRIEFPLDTMKEDVYKKLRVGGDLETVANNINYINTLKKRHKLGRHDSPKLNFSAIVMESTYKGIVDLIDFIEELGGASLGLRPLYCDLKITDWEKIKHEDIFENKKKTVEWRQIAKNAQKYAEGKGIELIDTTILKIAEKYPDLINNSDYADEAETDAYELCSCPWDSIYIGTGGLVYFSLCSKLLLGDINKSRFKDIWNGRKAINERERFINKNYSNCSAGHCIKNYHFAGTSLQKEDFLTKIKNKFF